MPLSVGSQLHCATMSSSTMRGKTTSQLCEAACAQRASRGTSPIAGFGQKAETKLFDAARGAADKTESQERGPAKRGGRLLQDWLWPVRGAGLGHVLHVLLEERRTKTWTAVPEELTPAEVGTHS